MSLTIKAFLTRGGNADVEIRRFQIPADVSSSHAYLSKKMVEIFPALKDGNFSLYWTDPDGDRILFSTDEEQMEALGYINDSIFKVHVKLNESVPTTADDDHNMVHPGVICDGCETPISGPRFKCLVCPDFDLCKICEAKGMHVQHNMRKIVYPVSAGGFPFCGPMGPPGTHGQGAFVPPPHFRRWMQRFMKRWHNRNAPGFECGDKDGEKGEKTEEKMEDGAEGQDSGESSGEEFLKNVGESVAEMLDPFGIDVDIEVEKKDGKRAKCEKKGNRAGCKGRGGRGCGKGRGRGCHGRRWQHGPNQGPWDMFSGWMQFPEEPQEMPCDGETPCEGCRGECGRKAPSAQQSPQPSMDKQQEKKADGNLTDYIVPVDENKEKKADGHLTDYIVPVDKNNITAAQNQMEIEPSAPKQADNSWTLIEPSQAPLQGPSNPAPNSAPNAALQQRPIYPPADPKIAEALDQMMAMGFNNDGGWLTSLLEAKNGDIIQVLDAIKPQQRPRSGPEGNMA